jgi:outer membrane murein-binding lipoprotein Lpp
MSQEMLIAASALVGLLVIAGTVLKAWHDWLALKGRELDVRRGPLEMDEGSREGAARIELADLKERIRKLEAIANGVDL